MEKLQWEKPLCYAIVRSKPEETVLTACKNITGGSDPGSDDTGCATTSGGCVICNTHLDS